MATAMYIYDEDRNNTVLSHVLVSDSDSSSSFIKNLYTSRMNIT